jgi:hypothetical protein
MEAVVCHSMSPPPTAPHLYLQVFVAVSHWSVVALCHRDPAALDLQDWFLHML